jgi:hypothetical protein
MPKAVSMLRAAWTAAGLVVAGLYPAAVGRQVAHDVVNQEIWAVDRMGLWGCPGMILVSQSET